MHMKLLATLTPLTYNYTLDIIVFMCGGGVSVASSPGHSQVFNVERM